MEYYAIRENNGNIERYNIFQHAIVLEDIKKYKELYLKNRLTRAELIEDLYDLFHYCFWSKCEHEIIVSQFPNPKNIEGTKIDIFYQLEKNIPLIADMLIAEWRNQ